MKKSLANQIAKLWNENFAGSYEPTRTIAKVAEGAKKNYYVEVFPDKKNAGNSFHHNEELADVMRTFKVSAYITTAERDGNVVVIGRFF